MAGLTAILATAAFFLPLVAALQPGTARWPSFMLSGDQWIFYFPSFVEGYRRFWHGGLLGLDFLTEDGASIFAYRPNMMPFYPPYLLAYLLTDCSDLAKGAMAYLAITMAHHFAGVYFTVVFIRRYLGLPIGAAILGAILYTTNSYVGEYIGEATFYYQAMMVPVLACALCWLVRTRSRFAPVFMAPLFASYALSNYAPMMLAGLGCAVAAALVSSAVLPRQARPRRWRSLVGPIASLGLAGLSTAPYFGAQIAYKGLIVPTVGDIDNVAHAAAFSGYDLLSAVSEFLDIRRARYEALLVWGAIPTFLALCGLHVVVVRKAAIGTRYLRIVGLASVVYLIVLLPLFGRSLLPAADLFFYAAPVVGTMHIYHRFLIFSQFFFAIAIAASTTVMLGYATPGNRVAFAYAGIAAWLGVTLCCLFWSPTGRTDAQGLLLEAFLVAVTGVTVSVASPGPAFLAVSVLAGMIGASSFYALPAALNTPRQWASEPDPLGPEMDAIAAFVEAHSGGRSLSKAVIASADIEPYFERNLPWLLGRRVKLMNFQGYPPHLSVLADYGEAWGAYGTFDLPWLHRTGLDFVFWSDASSGPLASILDDGFRLGETLTVAGGHHVAEILPAETAPAGGDAESVFDNGLLRVSGPGTAVQNFSTDYTREMRLDLTVAESSTVTYLLWPNPHMVPVVDGRQVGWRDPLARPLELDLGPGPHAVEVRFVSRAGSLFLISQFALVALAAVALLLEARRLRPMAFPNRRDPPPHRC